MCPLRKGVPGLCTKYVHRSKHFVWAMWPSASHIGVAEPVILRLFIMDDALLPDVGISHIMSAVRYFHPTAVCRLAGFAAR